MSAMSAAMQDDAVAAPRVGGDLSAARERLGWSLADVAAGLRIRLPYLIALEEGRIAELPGNAYALGFLRTYATALGLDPEELARRFRAEAAQVNRRTELSFPAPVPSRGVPTGAVVLLGVVLVVGAYIGWYRLSGDGDLPPEVVPPVPTRMAPLAEQGVRPTTVQQRPPISAVSAAQVSVAETSGLATAPATVSSPVAPAGVAGPLAAATADTGVLAAPLARQEPSVPPTQAAAATTSPAVAPLDSPRIVLSASEDAWMQVRDRSGQILLNRVLHPGEIWVVPTQPNLVLTTGNAGGTGMLVDGVLVPTLGASGAVRRDIPLDPDTLKSGKAASASLPTATANSAASAAPPVATPVGSRAASQ
jgi:cytoskeleton protein RodZ